MRLRNKRRPPIVIVTDHQITKQKDNKTTPDKEEKKKLWNSLEITKVALSLLTPLTILAITLTVNNSIKEKDKLDEARKAIITNRGKMWEVLETPLLDALSTMLNGQSIISEDSLKALDRNTKAIVNKFSGLIGNTYRTDVGVLRAEIFQRRKGYQYLLTELIDVKTAQNDVPDFEAAKLATADE